MWIVELSFTPDPRRLEFRTAHRDYLATLHQEGSLRMAGPLADDSGAMMIFDAETREDLDRLMAPDLYFTAPGVTVSSIRQWSPILT